MVCQEPGEGGGRVTCVLGVQQSLCPLTFLISNLPDTNLFFKVNLPPSYKI